MNEPITIPKHEELSESLDYSFLMRKGLDFVQQLSGDIWTDYNDHDPGVTILEQLTYGMTELAYKAHLSIEDIFHNTPDEAFNNQDYALFSADEVFPFTPLTADDYRRFIIDHIPQVRNAWVIPKEQSKLGFNVEGIYEVLLQLDDVTDERAIIKQVQRLLSEHRNLCEDFDEIKVLTPKQVKIKAEINVNSDVVGESLLANIAFTLSEILTPSIRILTLEEVLEKGNSLSEVIKRPIPKHGFIDINDLVKSSKQEIGTIHKSELIKNIADLEGVQGMGSFVLEIEGETKNGEVIIFEEEFPTEFMEGEHLYPLLDIASIFPADAEKESSIKLIIANDFEYRMNYPLARYTYDILVEQNRMRYQTELTFPKLTLENTIDNKEIAHFFSVQNTFPENYGIGKYGLSRRATPERKAHAKQLKGYLLLFEQVMLNYLSQLANAYKLFSIKDTLDQSYFYQTPKTVPNLEDLVGASKEDLFQKLGELNQRFDPVSKRQNQFLDHLLARFGEEFMHESFNILNQTSSWQNENEFQQTMTKAKLNFLSDYINISQSRGKGFDYLKSPENTDNVSGLKKRITYLFNLNDKVEGNLSAIEGADEIEVREVSEKKAKSKGGQFNFSSDSSNIQEDILLHGIQNNNYEINKETYQIIFTNPALGESCVIYDGESLEDSETKLEALIDYLKELNHQADNFYMVEHILLRPVDNRRFCYYFVSDNRRLLKSRYLYESEKEWFIHQIEQYGSKGENYNIQKNGEEYIVYLKNQKGEVIAYIDGFIERTSAEKGLDRAKLHIQIHTGGRKSIVDQIYTEEQTKRGAVLGNDPYSMMISVVFPAWTSRFQSQELRQLLEQMIHENAPAHLNINFFWMSPEEMAIFELYYKWWRIEKAALTPIQPLLDNLSFYLLTLLESFQEPDNEFLKEELEQLAREVSGF